MEDNNIDKKEWNIIDKLIVVIPTSCTVKSRVEAYNPQKIEPVAKVPMFVTASRAGQTDRKYAAPVYYIKEGVRDFTIISFRRRAGMPTLCLGLETLLRS